MKLQHCFLIAALLSAGATAARALPPLTAADNAGPEKWDGSGRVKCSVSEESYSRTCGYRVVHHGADATDIWMRNLAKNKSVYRVLRFTAESFATNEKVELSASRKGDDWAVRVDGREHYLIPNELLKPSAGTR